MDWINIDKIKEKTGIDNLDPVTVMDTLLVECAKVEALRSIAESLNSLNLDGIDTFPR